MSPVLPTTTESLPVTEIAPNRGWRSVDLAEVWRNRELVGYLAARDLKLRYTQTILGTFWAVFQPLVTVFVFTVIFAGVAGISSAGVPYPVFALAGLVPWSYFAAGVNRASVGLTGAAGIISKVYFPRLVLPLASMAVPMTDLALSAGTLSVLMLWFHQPIGARALLILPLLLIALAAALGFGLIVSALTIRYRDLSHALPFLIQIGMYATPVIYPMSLIQQRLEKSGVPGWLLGLNPMASVVAGTRDALFGSHDLTAGLLGLSVGVALAALAGGLLLFRRVENTVVDVI